MRGLLFAILFQDQKDGDKEMLKLNVWPVKLAQQVSGWIREVY
jgi:hypothetical protein